MICGEMQGSTLDSLRAPPATFSAAGDVEREDAGEEICPADAAGSGRGRGRGFGRVAGDRVQGLDRRQAVLLLHAVPHVLHHRPCQPLGDGGQQRRVVAQPHRHRAVVVGADASGRVAGAASWPSGLHSKPDLPMLEAHAPLRLPGKSKGEMSPRPEAWMTGR